MTIIGHSLVTMTKMDLECSVCGGKVIAPDDALKGEIVGCEDCGLEPWSVQKIGWESIQCSL